MDLFAIPVKKYRVIFWQTQIINVIVIIASYLLIKNNVYILRGFDPGQKLTFPIMGIVVILAVIHSQYQRKQLQQLIAIEDFEGRVEAYEKFYNLRMWWFVFSCASSCFLTVLTSRQLFLFYAMFDILISLQFFPTLKRFKRELQNDDILLY